MPAKSTIRELNGPAAGWQGIACWLALGGVSFWAPVIIGAAVLRLDLGRMALTVLPLGGLALLSGLTRYFRKTPRWGWMLGGIYLLGPTAMLAPSLLIQAPSGGPSTGGAGWLVFFYVFPPATIWLAALNGTIWALMAASLLLPLLAMRRQ